MGYIYQYSCSNCEKIGGSVYYGIGMMYPETNEDFRLFGCFDCGEVFGININKKFNRCPKCKKKSKELEFFETDEWGFNEDEIKEVKCPNCMEGNIQLHNVGMWD